MTVVSSLHGILAWMVIIVAGAAGAWATAAHWIERVRSPWLWRAQHLFHALVVVQVAFGSILVGFAGVDASQNHMFYGFLCLVGVSLIIGYRHLSEYRYLLYGLGGLFVMGLAIRALLLEPLAVP